MDFEPYLSALERSPATAFLGGSHDGEVRYMRRYVWRFQKLLAMIPASSRPIRVLDIGPTPFTLYLKCAHPDWDVWGLDRTTHLQERFEQAGVGLRSCDLDQVDIPFDSGYFDVVICAEVLEHVFAPPTKSLGEIARILRPSGTLLLTVPNLAVLRRRLRFLFGISPLENPDTQLATHPLHGHGHVREFTRREIVAACRSAGFELEHVRMVWKSPSDILRMARRDRGNLLKKAAHLGKLPHALLNLLAPSIRGNIMLLCRKPAAAEQACTQRAA